MKKLMLSMLAAFCVFGFTSCGNADKSSSAPKGTTSQTEAAQKSKKSDTTDKSANEQIDAKSDDTDKTESASDTIVVYFSATGTTKGVAERIANVTDADIFEIIPEEPYSDADLDWNDNNSRTTIEMNDPDVRPAIANDTVDLNGYTTVYIGYPIWWGDAPRIMSTFVEAHDFDDKTVIPFCTSGGSGIGRSGSNLASQAGSGNWLDGDRLDAGISESEIKDWINNMN